MVSMLLIIGTFRAPPERLVDALPAMAEMVAASRSEEGCEAYVYAEDVTDPGLIHVKELWRDQTCLDRHFASGHIARWRAAWTALGLHDRDLLLYQVERPSRI